MKYLYEFEVEGNTATITSALLKKAKTWSVDCKNIGVCVLPYRDQLAVSTPGCAEKIILLYMCALKKCRSF